MAITKVGVIVSKNRDLSNPLIFENRGGQIGENTVQLSGLDAATLYYTRGYFVQDGITTEERQIHSFQTAEAVEYFWAENRGVAQNSIVINKYGTPWATDFAYSTDGENWTIINATTSVVVESGEKVYFRSSTGLSKDNSNYYKLTCASGGNWKVGGRMSTLLNYNGDVDLRKVSYCFYLLFSNSYITDASDLVIDIPAMGLKSCYQMFSGNTLLVSPPQITATAVDDNSCYQMFYGCTVLASAPALPATTLGPSCYNSMFQNCSSLTQAPAILPATTLASRCYSYMFQNCSSLAQAPALPATALAEYCYQSMFYGCSSLTQAPALPATTMASNCYDSMFWTCSSLAQAPVVSATTLAKYCFQSMFRGCSSLTQAPALPATTLAEYCYTSMFYNCTALTSAPALPATTLAEHCYHSMFQGCDSLAQAPSLPATTLANSCYYSMFYGCSSLTQAPALTATTLATNCYQSMFYNCTALASAPALPATTLANNCYNIMFYGCTSLAQAPSLPATTLANSCYYRMFYECSGIQESPELPATTLVSNCYYQMFYNCSQLSKITVHATSWNNSYANNWAYGVAAAGDFYNLGEANNIPIDNASGVPVGWTVRTARAEDTPLTFKNTASGSNTITLKGQFASSTPSFAITLDYSTDGGITWTTWSSSNGDLNVSLTSGQSVIFKGDNTAMSSDQGYYMYNFRSTDSCTVGGNAMSLLDSTLQSVSITTTCALANIFNNMTHLDIDDLVLPATTLSDWCYYGMFWGCTSLTKAPKLPATTLSDACYREMFKNCSSLTQSPNLPATTLSDACYELMFEGCTSLTQAPVLNAMNLAEGCYLGMFEGCTSLTQAPALPATTLATNCYQNMFWGTSITASPVLPATTLAENCYSAMFYNCSSLTSITTYANSITYGGLSCIPSWVYGVGSTGDFYNLGGATYPSGDSGIPSGWTEHTSI